MAEPPLSGYSLWLEAREEEQSLLQFLVDDVAQKYGTRRFGAHATLLGLLEKTERDLEQMRSGSTFLANSCTRFTTEIIGVGIRDMYFQSVFLLVAPSRTLMNLNDLARVQFDHQNDPPFMPHWSGVYGNLDYSTKRSIADEIVSRVRFPLTVTIANVALVDVKGYPNEWKIIERFPLPT